MEREANWEKENINASKMREEKEKQEKFNEKNEKDRNKCVSKQQEKQHMNLAKTDEVNNINFKSHQKSDKSLPNGVKQILGDGFELEKIPGNGACGMGSFAKHAFDDVSLGPKIGEELNKETAENFWHYRKLLEFPYSRQVGGSSYVCFGEHEVEQLLDFLRNHPRNGNVLRGFMDMQALSNKYGMPIKIASITDIHDTNPKVERMEPDGDFEVKEQIEEMILLNTGRYHFDLIRKNPAYGRH